jgi:uncharacterized protein (DUF2147 family)
MAAMIAQLCDIVHGRNPLLLATETSGVIVIAQLHRAVGKTGEIDTGRLTLSYLRNLGLAAVFSLGFAGSALADAGANGVWIMENGKVTVRIAPCGANLCGSIVSMAKPLDKEGNPKLDKNNPNNSLRGRPVIGLRILSNMVPKSESKWAGTVYNADDGRTYSSYMKLSGNKMKVKGCIGPFCKAITFNRVN